MASWDEALGAFLKPFVALLGHKKRRQMCPLYVAGLIGPGERKSMQPMAERLDPARYDRVQGPAAHAGGGGLGGGRVAPRSVNAASRACVTQSGARPKATFAFNWSAA